MMDNRKISASGAALTIVAAAWIAGCAGNGNDAAQEDRSPVAQQPAGKTGGAAGAASLAAGANVAAFDVTTISGELKGKTLCYV